MRNVLTKGLSAVGQLLIGGQPYGVVNVCNKTGNPITAGKLVYISGYDATLDCPTITLADADTSAKAAQYVTKAAIANNARGLVYAKYEIGGLNTNAGAVGDPVYLSATAGGWALAAPNGADQILQIVGYITAKSATVGKIIFLLQPRVITKVGTSGLQDATILDATPITNLVDLTHLKDDQSSSIFVVKGEIDFGESNVVDTDLGLMPGKGTLIAGYATITEAQVGGDATTTIKVSKAAAGATPICDDKVVTLANTADGQSNKVGTIMGINPIAAGVDVLSTEHIYLYCADDVAGTRSAGKMKVVLFFMKSA